MTNAANYIIGILSGILYIGAAIAAPLTTAAATVIVGTIIIMRA